MSHKVQHDPSIERLWLLDAYDLHLASEEGSKRQNGKRSAGIRTKKFDKDRTDLDIDIFGARGELAVCRILNLNPEEQWAGHDYSKIDSGIDLTLPDGRTLDVKTRKPGGHFAMNPERGESAFKADIGVLVWLRDGRVAHAIGAFDREMWGRDSGWVDFGRQGQLRRWAYEGNFFSVTDLQQKGVVNVEQ